MSDLGSIRSTGSFRSGSRLSIASGSRVPSGDSIEKGPKEVWGKLFLRLKRCVFCLLLNTDANPIKSGPLASCLHVVWGAGTNAKPEGILCKPCKIGYVQGGFAAEYDTPDKFAAARRERAELNKEWEATNTAVISFLDNLTGSRIRENVLDLIGVELVQVRKVAVEAYRQSQRTVNTSYHAFSKAKFEKQCPGHAIRGLEEDEKNEQGEEEEEEFAMSFGR